MSQKDKEVGRQEDGGYLMQNMLLFGRILHGLGLQVHPGNMIDAMRALEHVEIGRRPDFYFTLRGILVQHKEHLELFDQAFDAFWKTPSDGSFDIDMTQHREETQTQQTVMASAQLEDVEESLDESDEEEDEETRTLIEVTKTYSTTEALAQKDFEEMTIEELDAVKRLMAQLVWQLGQRRTRRREVGKSHVVDLRRSLRRNFRYGGEMLEWSRLTQKIKPRPLVVIADISGSMERYSKLLIHFLYSLAEGLDQRVEVFVFSTRLTRITRQLRNRDADRAIAEATSAVPDWGGGTRIGEAIKAFNHDWGRRVLRGGAVTMLISDGWDRGDPEVLGREMERLQKMTHRLIWLNPLLSSDNYEPLTRGLVAAIPFVDDFLPVHNLNTLQDLAQHLALMDGNKRLPDRHLRGAAFIGRK